MNFPVTPVMASAEGTILFLRSAATLLDDIGAALGEVVMAGQLTTTQQRYLTFALQSSDGARKLFVAEILRQGGEPPSRTAERES